MTEITEQKQLRSKLEEQEYFLNSVMDHAPNLIYVTDWDGRYQHINNSMAEYLGASPERIVGNRENEFLPDEIARKNLEETRKCLVTDEIIAVEEIEVDRPSDGQTRCFQTTKIPIQSGKDPETGQVLTVATDITDRVQLERSLKATIDRKNSLLKQVHHRVKNNLQLMATLVIQQARQLSEEESVGVSVVQHRIETMAILHEKLYRDESFEKEIALSPYLSEVANRTASHYRDRGQRIKPRLKSTDDVSVSFEVAIAFGLMLDECIRSVTEILPAGEENHGYRIPIELSVISGGELRLRIEVPAEDLDNSGHDPFTLVRTLAEQQLSGSFTRDDEETTTLTIRSSY